jgi:hypothetical protein
MGNRWSPGSSEWIRVIDYGDAAAWVRPEPDGASIAVYLGGYYDGRTADIWVVRVGRGSDLLDTIRDKIHRIGWVEHRGSEDPSGVIAALSDNFLVRSYEHRQEPISHRGHPRLNHNRRIWLDPLPRRIQEAIGYP